MWCCPSWGGIRCSSCVRVRTLLSRLNHLTNIFYMYAPLTTGTLGTADGAVEHVQRDLAAHGIGLVHAEAHLDCTTPSSYITLSQKNGSRTIAVYRGPLPELSLSSFTRISRQELLAQRWVHFEGRNVENVVGMLSHLRAVRDGESKEEARCRGVSLEIERKRPDGELRLLPYADVVFVSKEYVTLAAEMTSPPSAPPSDPIAFLSALHRKHARPGAVFVVGWGERGAYGAFARSSGEVEVVLVGARKLKDCEVIDTIGAGDSFIAGFLCARIAQQGQPSPPQNALAADGANQSLLQAALARACRVAERKITRHGFELQLAQDEPTLVTSPASSEDGAEEWERKLTRVLEGNAIPRPKARL